MCVHDKQITVGHRPLHKLVIVMRYTLIILHLINPTKWVSRPYRKEDTSK